MPPTTLTSLSGRCLSFAGVGPIRSFFESHGLTLSDWQKARTDRVIVGESSPRSAVA